MNILDTKFSNIFYHIEVEFHDEASNSYPTPETNGCESGLPSVVDSNYKQYKKLQLVYLMATKYQREREWKFGWFVRVRPDMAWLVAVEVEVESFATDRNTIWVPQNNFFPMNDQFAIIPAAAADTYFNSVEGLFVCSTFEHFPPQHSPEYVMYKHLVSDNKAKIEFYDFHAVIVREGERG
ncbi:hypothetical protein ScalyP_jg6391, partial [Parmales sp. scaly parma]